MVSCSSLIAPLIALGDLHSARFAALDYSLRVSNNHLHPSRAAITECARAWTKLVGELLNINGDGGGSSFDQALIKIESIHHRHYVEKASLCYSNISNTCSAVPKSEPALDEWERCCRRIQFGPYPSADESSPPVTCGPDRATPDSPGCAIGVGSGAALLLPLVNEQVVRIRLPPPAGRILEIEQDGILQPYDVSTILWPGGYLLSLWVNDFFAKHSNTQRDNHPFSIQEADNWLQNNIYESTHVLHRPLSILELGAGVGATSIAAAVAAAASQINVTIVATDRSPMSLALITANAALNGVAHDKIHIHRLDFTNHTSVAALASPSSSFTKKKRFGVGGQFDLVLGASLEYELWEDQFCDVLGTLTRDGGMIALVHVTDGIDKPPMDSCFVEVGRISGAHYGMKELFLTANNNGECESCFEIVVWRKKAFCPLSG